jgi:hypothetical protein
VDHEGRLGDAEGRAAEAFLAGGLEAEPGVVGRRALQEDQRFGPVLQDGEGVADQAGADAAVLVGRVHGQRGQDQHVDQPGRGVEQVDRGQHVADDLAG